MIAEATHLPTSIPSQHIRRCAECGAPVAYFTFGRETATPFGPAAEPTLHQLPNFGVRRNRYICVDCQVQR